MGSSSLVSLSRQLKNPESIREYLLHEMGIGADVILIDDRPAIKVTNHLSLFSIITKIRNDFDFEVFHKKEKNEYIIYLLVE